MSSSFPLVRRYEASIRLSLEGDARITQALLAFLLFSGLSFLRNAYAFSYPILFGEDGYWIGRIMVDGFWHTLIHARPDYGVAALVALNGISLLITRALFLSDISALPQVISIVASFVFGFVAVLPLLTLRGLLHPIACWLIGFAIVFIPVGNDSYEIFGRILNLGFYMPVIAQFVLIALLYRKIPIWFEVLLQLAMIGLMWSFPVVIGQYLIYIAFDALQRHAKGASYGRRTLTHVLVLILGTTGFNPLALIGSGGVLLPFKFSSFIEFAIARSAIFPFVAPIYHELSDIVTITIFGLILVSVGFFLRRSGQIGISLLDYRVFLFLNFGVMWAATLVMRRGLTSFLDNYSTSFPDRYFTGVNIMFLVACMALALGHPLAAYRRFAGLGFGTLIIYWLVSVPIFQRTMTDMEQRDFGTFRDTICDRAAGRSVVLPSSSPDFVVLPSYPSAPGYSWKVSVERQIFDQTVRAQCR